MLALLRKQRGQTMAEYAIVLGVIAVGVVLAIGLLSDAISAAINNVANQI